MRQCKAKKCKECQEYFTPVNSLQNVCNWKCALERVNRINIKKATQVSKKEESLRKRELRARREAIRPRSYYVKLAQASFNAFIRERDIGQVCISCQKPPKKVQAGHYKTTAARPDIRFHPFNNNLQCFHCNVHKSGAIDLYRPNLIKKIGLKNVEWLEQEQPLQNLTVDDLKDIKQYYKEQLKQLSAISAGE